MNKEQLKKHIVTFLKLSIAIVVIWYLFKSGRLTKEALIGLFKVDGIPFIMISCLFFLGSQILAAARLGCLLKTINLPIRFQETFKFIMIGNFFNMVIPGVFGGDFVKAFYLVKNEKNSKGRSSGIVVIDRILGLFAILFIGGISIFYLLQQNNVYLTPYLSEIYLISVIICSSFCVAAAYILLGGNQKVREKLKQIFAPILRKSFFYHIAGGLGTPAKNWKVLLCSFLISLLIQLMSLTGLLILVNILPGSRPDLFSLFSVSAVVILLGVIPVTPGNLGWTELIASFGWSAVGSSAGAEIFFYWRIVVVLCSLPGGLLYLLSGQRHEQMLKQQKEFVN